MALLSIDENLCKKDGICAAECPMAIISWKKNQYPVAAANGPGLCINCGHCVAVCPHGALSHIKLAPEDCLAMDPGMKLSPFQTEHFLRSRRSIRNFKKTPVPRETIKKIIELACFAPSGHNMQPVHWRVLNGREVVKSHTDLVIEWMEETTAQNPKFAKALHLDMLMGAWKLGMDAVTRNAPALILAQGPIKNPSSPTACTIAMTYLDLAAQSFDIGTCWCGYFLMAAADYQPLKEKLGADQGLITHGVMMAGFPVYAYHRMPTRNKPRITWTQ